MDSSLPRPNLWRLRSSLRCRLHIRAGIIMYSGFPGFDLCPLHPLPRGWSSPAALSPFGAALPGGNRFPCFDPGAFPWGRLMGRRLFPWGFRRWWLCRDLLRGRVWLSMRLHVWVPAFGSFFPFQQSLHATHGPPYSIGGSVLDPVTAVVAGLSTLGGLPELAPQTLRVVIQATADNLFGCRLDFFL